MGCIRTRVFFWLVVGCLLAGCGAAGEPTSCGVRRRARAAGARRERAPQRQSPLPAAEAPGGSEGPSAGQHSEARPEPVAPAADVAAPRGTERPGVAFDTGPAGHDSSTDRPEPLADSADRWLPNLPRLRVDERRAAAAGIRKLSGRRLTLYTDMPPGPQIDRLPRIFDRAFPQWCAYFHVEPSEHADWNMTGFLMKDKALFRKTGLLPDDLPPFPHGFARNYDLWLYDQPSDYYRRHLLLHEGTHGFMNTILGGCGPPWYMEGIAELLATHRWQDDRLTLNHMPAGRHEVPHWGRIRIIKDALAEGRTMRLEDVIGYSRQAHRRTEPYAWCWAAAALLDRHPRYQQRFRQLFRNVLARDFSQRFYRLMGDDWEPLCEQWQLFVSDLEYGHDVAATAVDFAPGDPLPADGATVRIAADRGWQNSGLRLEGGATYRLRARGRYQVADQPQIWWCEPGGVSIRYYKGRPLGILLAAVRPDGPIDQTASALLRPRTVGLGATLPAKADGTLYLKINDSAAELSDNAGSLTVEVKRQ